MHAAPDYGTTKVSLYRIDDVCEILGIDDVDDAMSKWPGGMTKIREVDGLQTDICITKSSLVDFLSYLSQSSESFVSSRGK